MLLATLDLRPRAVARSISTGARPQDGLPAQVVIHSNEVIGPRPANPWTIMNKRDSFTGLVLDLLEVLESLE